jgi:DNA repair protein RadA/Sms
MKKQRLTVYRCSSCGHEEPKWLGRCPECGEWNSLVEGAANLNAGARGAGGAAREFPTSVPLSSVDSNEGSRISSGINELDRVLGSGIMKRSTVLVGGEPGIGKSTLMLQMAAAAQTSGRILYVSAEESAGQVKMRADRLGLSTGGGAARGGSSASGADIGRIEIFCSGHLNEIENVLNATKPVIVIVDSAQTLISEDAGSVPGTVNQLKYCSFELITWVKEHDAALFLVAHVTKDGVISGPKTLEHMVDTVLYFEQSDNDSRFLRASKNRFGSVDEIGIFTMGETGLSPVDDLSKLFLVRREGALPAGVATAAVLEGSRTLLVEIQALTIPAKGAVSRVFSDRVPEARVSRVAATLEKALQLRLSDQDIYVNIAGGIRINDVAVELALAACLYSARTGLALPQLTAIAGELSLAAEVMPIRRAAGRVRGAALMGFEKFVLPATASAYGAGGTGGASGSIATPDTGNSSDSAAPPVQVCTVKSLQEAIAALWGPDVRRASGSGRA